MKANKMFNIDGVIKSGILTDSGEFTPVDTVISTMSLLEKEGIKPSEVVEAGPTHSLEVRGCHM